MLLASRKVELSSNAVDFKVDGSGFECWLTGFEIGSSGFGCCLLPSGSIALDSDAVCLI